MNGAPGVRPAPLRGLVLAGGASARLGRDKAAVEVNGVPVLERCVGLLAGLVGDVRVAVRDDQVDEPLRRRFRLLIDTQRGIGPAAGLLAAQQADPAAAWLALACDMPRVTETTLRRLLAARDPGRGATAFRAAADGLPEPLCAIYEPATLRCLRQQIGAGGSSSLRELLAAVHPVLLDAVGTEALASINTPEDLERLTRPQPPGGASAAK